MLLKHLLFLILSISAFVPQAKAQDLYDTLEYLMDKALSVRIVTRVYESDEVSVWNMESVQLTVSGRAVKVVLENKNHILLTAYITPYLSSDDTILLVAYGEVTFPNLEENGKSYYSSMKSVPIKPGEKVIFFPLGVAVDSDTNIYTLELEIQVQPYRMLMERDNQADNG